MTAEKAAENPAKKEQETESTAEKEQETESTTEKVQETEGTTEKGQETGSTTEKVQETGNSAGIETAAENLPPAPPELSVIYHEYSRKSRTASPENMGYGIRSVSGEEIRPESELFIREDTEVTIRMKTRDFDPDRINLAVYEENYQGQERKNVTSGFLKKERWRQEDGDMVCLSLSFCREGHFRLEIAYTDPWGQTLIPHGHDQEGCFREGVYYGPQYTLDKQCPEIMSVNTKADPLNTVEGIPCFAECPGYEIIIREENFHPAAFMLSGTDLAVNMTGWTSYYQEGHRMNKMEFSPKGEGKYPLSFRINDGSGRKAEGKKDFMVDASAPSLTVGPGDETALSLYSYASVQMFAQKKISFRIKATDQISGIASIHYSYMDSGGTVVEETRSNPVAGGDQEISLSLDKDDFCGWIVAFCTDYLGHSSPETISPVFLWESRDMFAQTGEAALEYSDAVYTDTVHKIKYYKEAPRISLLCRNPYAGIRDSYLKTVFGKEESGEGKDLHLEKDISCQSVQTITLDPGTYASSRRDNPVLIRYGFTDNAGYQVKEKEASYGIVVDRTAPVISLKFTDEEIHSDSEEESGDGNIGKTYYASARSAVITVTDWNFRPSSTKWEISGEKDGYSLGKWQGSGKKHWCKVDFTGDGSYRIGLTVRDYAGNSASYCQKEDFVIDRTSPSLILWMDRAGVKNKKYYAQAQDIYVLVRDKNVPRKGISLLTGKGKEKKISPAESLPKGAVREAGKKGWSVYVYHAEAEGHYRISCICRDLAGNISPRETLSPFVIDCTPPEVRFAGDPGITYTEKVTPGVAVSDTNLDGNRCRMSLCFRDGTEAVNLSRYFLREENGRGKLYFSWKDFPRRKELDNAYILKTSVCDLAGNSPEEKNFLFYVDRWGARYSLTEDTASYLHGYYRKQEGEITVVAYSLHPLETEILVTRNNEEVFKVDEKDIRTEEKRLKGTEKEVDQDILPFKYKGWYRTLYHISKELFAREGDYRISLRSREPDPEGSGVFLSRSGNELWTVPIMFAVDKTAPSVRIGGLEEENYALDRKEYTITAMDNALLKKVKVYVRSEKGEESERSALYTIKDFDEDHSLTAFLDSRPGYQIVGYEAWDSAGNKISSRNTGKEKRVLVMRPSLVRTVYLHRVPLALILLASVFLLILILLTERRFSDIVRKTR